jgi:hypothetical protein
MRLLWSSSLYRAAELTMLTIVLGITLRAQNGYNFSTIDFPGGTATQARGVNQQGDVVGIYTDPGTGLWRGFRLSSGNYSKIDFPGASQTYPRGIDMKKDVVGFFADSSGVAHGFLLNSGGFQQIDVPGSLQTAVRAIADNGLIVGDTTFDNLTSQCFVLKNGTYSTFSFPGQNVDTCVGVSKRGDVLGYYSNGSDFTFIRRLGRFSPISVPGATSQDPFGMNDLDQVVGTFIDSSGAQHGYMADIAMVTIVDPPGAHSVHARGINVKGVIVGSYSASGVTHGFVATPNP